MEEPEESEIECYFYRNEREQGSYVYCKVVYETITEEFLYENYEIQNVFIKEEEYKEVNFNPGISSEFKEKVLRMSYNGIKKKEIKKGTNKLTYSLRYSAKREDSDNTYFYDELSLHKPNKSHKIYYVPIVVSIETCIPHIEIAKSILNSLISVIFKNNKYYAKDTHNSIFSYVEFSSHVLSLTHITVPPPLTCLSIPIANTKILLQEGYINEFPCTGDTSIYYLFSMLPVDYIVMLWSALLLEKSVIIHVPNHNTYFYIVKALLELLFPLTWSFSKGVINNLEFLTVPIPYCFGILSTDYSDEDEIISELEESEDNLRIEYMMLIFRERESAIFTELREILQAPNEQRLKEDLEKCCKEFNIGPEIKASLKKTEEFSRQVQVIFRNAVMRLLKYFEDLVKVKKDGVRLAQVIAKLKLKSVARLKEREIEFLNKLKATQAVADLYDQQYSDIQGNYARKLAINMKEVNKVKLPEIEVLNITISSAPSIVLSRLNKLIELNEESVKCSFDWKKEVAKMQKISVFERASYNCIIKEETKLKSSNDMYKSVSIELLEWESKHKINSEFLVPVKIASKASVMNRFYGRKGILSFLEKFIKPEYEQGHKKIIVEEIDRVKYHFKPITQINISSNEVLDNSHSDKSPETCSSITPKSILDNNNGQLLLNYSTKCSMQLELFFGYLYNNNDPESALQKFIEAFKYAYKKGKYEFYFPMMMLRSLMKKLTLEEIKRINVIELKEIKDEIVKIKKKMKEEVLIKEEKKDLPYLNYGEVRATNANPNILLRNALKSLIDVIHNCKSNVASVKDSKEFKLIQEQIKVLAVLLNVINSMKIS